MIALGATLIASCGNDSRTTTGHSGLVTGATTSGAVPTSPTRSTLRLTSTKHGIIKIPGEITAWCSESTPEYPRRQASISQNFQYPADRYVLFQHVLGESRTVNLPQKKFGTSEGRSSMIAFSIVVDGTSYSSSASTSSGSVTFDYPPSCRIGATFSVVVNATLGTDNALGVPVNAKGTIHTTVGELPDQSGSVTTVR